MSKYLWVLVLFFVEIILETGFQLATSFVRGVSFKNIVLYGLLLFVFGKYFSERKRFVDRYILITNRLILGYLVFCILILTSKILFPMPNYDWIVGLERYKSNLLDTTACFFIFYYFANSLHGAGALISRLVFIVGIAALATLVDTVLPSIEWFGLDGDSKRPNGAFGEPNQSAAVFSMVFPLILMKLMVRNFLKPVYIILAVATLAAIAATGSRGGMLGTVVGSLAFLLFVNNQLTIGKKLAFTLAAPLIIISTWLVIPDYYQELIISRLSFLGEEEIDYSDASAGRIFIWNYALSLWAERPVFGLGWAGFQIVAGGSTHSIYIERLTDTGLVGFIIFVAIQYRILSCLITTRKYALGDAKVILSAMSAGLVGLYVSLIFVNLYVPALITWALTGVMISYANQVRSERAYRVSIASRVH